MLGVLFIGWIGAKMSASLFVLSALFDFANGARQGMIVAGLLNLTTDSNRLETRYGMVLAVLSIGVGSPLVAGSTCICRSGEACQMGSAPCSLRAHIV